MGRVGHFAKGLSEGRGPGGGLPGAAGGGTDAAEGAAGEAGAAEGIGAIAEEAAPLLLAA